MNGDGLLPTVVRVRSALPPFLVTQEAFHALAREWFEPLLGDVRSLMDQTRVRQRYMFWDPLVEYAGGRSPGFGLRMRAFEELVVEALHACTEEALAGVDRERVGSFVSTTNTGYCAPMIDCIVARQLGLRSSLRRTVIGSMGCFSAMNAIKVALDALAARPDELVLVNATEASSLHMTRDATKEQAVVHALFGDASASMLMRAAPRGEGTQFLRTHTEQLHEAADLMTLRITDEGNRMTLSPFVPFVIAENIERFLDQLLSPLGLRPGDIRHWGIHPGGPKIVDLITARMGLKPQQVRASWHVLEQRGNCAAATALLVLEDILANDSPARGDHGVLLSFGPGLTIEGAVIAFGGEVQ